VERPQITGDLMSVADLFSIVSLSAVATTLAIYALWEIR
jgi:hypothetical protein